MQDSEARLNLKHEELNRVSLFCLLLLASIIAWRSALALAGNRSWDGIPIALLVLGILTFLAYFQLKLTTGVGLREFWHQCSLPAEQRRKLNFIDGCLIFIYISGMNAYIIYLAILG
ncbi:hypothetical protein [Gimesia chilikensis]|uniref:hypothetical protein n=1 Tax=Gimesia chilikensis TaxID=2605989 RepID=UPI003A953408